MKNFFTSDTHLGDHRVLNIRPRPFGSVSEMNEALVARWNARGWEAGYSLAPRRLRIGYEDGAIDIASAERPKAPRRWQHRWRTCSIARLVKRASLCRACDRGCPAGAVSLSVSDLEWNSSRINQPAWP